MNRNGFTLIEVLVSVAILAVVATGLFQIALNSKNNFAFLEQKAQFDRIASIPIMHNDPKYHHQEKSLYEFLREDYDIRQDDVRKALKERKVQYTQEEYARFSLAQELGDTQERGQDENDLQSLPAMDMTLLFDKITIYDKHHSTYVYRLESR